MYAHTCKFCHFSTGSGQTSTRFLCFIKGCKKVVFPEPIFPSTITVYGLFEFVGIDDIFLEAVGMVRKHSFCSAISSVGFCF